MGRTRKITTRKGVKYASEFEAGIAQKLERKTSLEVEYESEVLEYVLVKKYNPDFKVTLPNGDVLYIEAKGYFDREARAKMLAVKEQHPDKRICFVFQQDNLLHRKAKERYSQWAERHGFEWAIQELPVEWFKPHKPNNKKAN